MTEEFVTALYVQDCICAASTHVDIEVITRYQRMRQSSTSWELEFFRMTERSHGETLEEGGGVEFENKDLSAWLI